jgi:hypothetical protein
MHFLRTLLAAIAILLLSIGLFELPMGGGIDASAHSVAHQKASMSDCAKICAVNNVALSDVSSTLSQREKQKEPDEQKPQKEPYYAQFYRLFIPHRLAATSKGSADLLRPPDLVKLYARYRN